MQVVKQLFKKLLLRHQQQVERSVEFALPHCRSPSMEDAAKKSQEWAELQSAIFTDDDYTDQTYEEATFFFNQIRDVSMARFGKELRQRVSELMRQPSSK